MKAHLTAAAAILLATGLAGCGGPPDSASNETAAPTTAAPAAAGAMAAGAPGSEVRTAAGVGAVTAVDAEAGTITIDHAPIPEAGWPAMTMGFQAAPEIVRSVSVGDKVAFDLMLKDGGGEITAIRPE
jgi:Cu/Ag efflux protein CusF